MGGPKAPKTALRELRTPFRRVPPPRLPKTLSWEHRSLQEAPTRTELPPPRLMSLEPWGVVAFNT